MERPPLTISNEPCPAEATDYAPNRTNAVPPRIEPGRIMPVLLVKESQWIGRVKGIALAINGILPQPLIVRGLQAKPMGAVDGLGGRVAARGLDDPGVPVLVHCHAGCAGARGGAPGRIEGTPLSPFAC
jgi:hypothetical protein